MIKVAENKYHDSCSQSSRFFLASGAFGWENEGLWRHRIPSPVVLLDEKMKGYGDIGFPVLDYGTSSVVWYHDDCQNKIQGMNLDLKIQTEIHAFKERLTLITFVNRLY